MKWVDDDDMGILDMFSNTSSPMGATNMSNRQIQVMVGFVGLICLIGNGSLAWFGWLFRLVKVVYLQVGGQRTKGFR